MAIYSILQCANFVLNETRWLQVLIEDPSATSFLQVLLLLTSRALLYLLLQLSARHWPHLRHQLSRVEWRSILGLTLFASLADLVFLSGNVVTGNDLLPLGAVQSALLVTTAWRTGRQMAQIAGFRTQLGRTGTSVMVERRKVYGRHWRYHVAALVLQIVLLVGIVSGTMVGALELVDTRHLVSVVSQSLLVILYMFWSICTSTGLIT